MSRKKTTKGKRSPATKRTTHGKPVIVRTFSAGVHFGYLTSRSADGAQVTLSNARRCFRFQVDYTKHGTHQVTCSELAVYGPSGDSKIATRVSSHDLVGVIEVLDASPAAVLALEGWPQ